VAERGEGRLRHPPRDEVQALQREDLGAVRGFADWELSHSAFTIAAVCAIRHGGALCTCDECASVSHGACSIIHCPILICQSMSELATRFRRLKKDQMGDPHRQAAEPVPT
jgi:hypothetical protein